MMKSYLKPFPGFCLLLSSLGLVSANPLEQWDWRNPLPQGNNLAGIRFIDGRFVAVGAGPSSWYHSGIAAGARQVQERG